jgi:hypothetical protein
MQNIVSTLTSKAGITGVLAGIVWFLTQITPILPPVWGNLVSAILGVVALYWHGTVITAARAVNIRGVNGKLV